MNKQMQDSHDSLFKGLSTSTSRHSEEASDYTEGCIANCSAAVVPRYTRLHHECGVQDGVHLEAQELDRSMSFPDQEKEADNYPGDLHDMLASCHATIGSGPPTSSTALTSPQDVTDAICKHTVPDHILHQWQTTQDLLSCI